MSSVQSSTQPAQPTQIDQYSPTEMLLAWSTGERYAVKYTEIRFFCPCAHCVDEHTGKRILKREDVKTDVRPTGADSVGRYAIRFSWSDRHSSGLYSYDLLRQICERAGRKI